MFFVSFFPGTSCPFEDQCIFSFPINKSFVSYKKKIITRNENLVNIISAVCLHGFWWRSSLSSTGHRWQRCTKSQRASYEGADGNYLCASFEKWYWSKSYLLCLHVLRMESAYLMIFYERGWLNISMSTRKTTLWFVPVNDFRLFALRC